MAYNTNAKKLIKALRSGNYKQGRHYLQVNDLYCPLGVACDLYCKEYPQWAQRYRKRDHNGVVTFAGDSITLPPIIRKWLNFATEMGNFDADFNTIEFDTITSLNDHGMSFKEIADVIKAEPDGLFEKC